MTTTKQDPRAYKATSYLKSRLSEINSAIHNLQDSINHLADERDLLETAIHLVEKGSVLEA